MATGTGTTTARSGPGAWSGGDRLPVAPRQRRPALAALALLLILGGGLISAVLVIRSGQKEAVIVIRQDIAEGHEITLDDLASVQVAAPGELGVVPWSERQRVVGMTAGVSMKRGTILNRLATATDSVPATGNVKAGISLKPGRIPAEGLVAGEHVSAIWTPASEASSGSNSPKRPASAVLVKDAVVYTASRAKSDGSITLTLVVADSEEVALLQWAALSSVSLVTLPLGS